jgi:hypothetical protein
MSTVSAGACSYSGRSRYKCGSGNIDESLHVVSDRAGYPGKDQGNETCTVGAVLIQLDNADDEWDHDDPTAEADKTSEKTSKKTD